MKNGNSQNQAKARRVFSLGIDFAEKVLPETKTIHAADRQSLFFQIIILFFFSKAFKTFQAVEVLWQKGFSQDSLMLTRTIFELSCQARFLAKDPKGRTTLFLHHDPVLRFRMYRTFKRLGIREITEAIEKNPKFSALKRDHDKFEKKFKNKMYWWGGSFEELVKNLGEEIIRRYATVYKEASQLIHTNISATREYIEFSERDRFFKFNCYPEACEDLRIPQEATLYFLDLISETVKALDLVNLNQPLVLAFKEFETIFGLPKS